MLKWTLYDVNTNCKHENYNFVHINLQSNKSKGTPLALTFEGHRAFRGAQWSSSRVSDSKLRSCV